MSKSTGNFLTLAGAVEKYSADGKLGKYVKNILFFSCIKLIICEIFCNNLKYYFFNVEIKKM